MLSSQRPEESYENVCIDDGCPDCMNHTGELGSEDGDKGSGCSPMIGVANAHFRKT